MHTKLHTKKYIYVQYSFYKNQLYNHYQYNYSLSKKRCIEDAPLKYIYFSIKILFAIFFALSTVNSSGLNLNTQLKAIPLK